MIWLKIIKIFKTIKNNPKLLLFVYCVLVTILAVFLIKRNSTIASERDRYDSNQSALMTEIETYKTESGKNAAKVQQLELTADEFKKNCEDQAAIIEDMGLKIKRLKYTSSNGINTNIDINTVLKDTVIYEKIDTVYVANNAKSFKWNDDWNSIEGTIVNDKVNCKYNGSDTLTVAAVKVPHKFWFIKWGCKYVEVDIANQNPCSQVVWNRTVKFKN